MQPDVLPSVSNGACVAGNGGVRVLPGNARTHDNASLFRKGDHENVSGSGDYQRETSDGWRFGEWQRCWTAVPAQLTVALGANNATADRKGKCNYVLVSSIWQ